MLTGGQFPDHQPQVPIQLTNSKCAHSREKPETAWESKTCQLQKWLIPIIVDPNENDLKETPDRIQRNGSNCIQTTNTRQNQRCGMIWRSQYREWEQKLFRRRKSPKKSQNEMMPEVENLKNPHKTLSRKKAPPTEWSMWETEHWDCKTRRRE